MPYHFTTTLSLPFDTAIEQAKAALKAKGFGVLTTIDVAATLKAKIGVDMQPYVILGACNPKYAYEALQQERKIGTMLPCNVIVQQNADGSIDVSAVDPIASMQAIDNAGLASVAETVRGLLKEVIASLGGKAA
jgi:uncharacterized protein (DUF302 family)